MAGTIPFPEYASTQRSKRRWVLRVAAALVVIAAIGYASLPWWLPTDWLSRRLVNQLAAELNRGVRIDRVRIGWVAGAVFEGITVEDRPGSSQPVLATIGRLGCDFEPLTMLLTGRVHEIQIDEPTLYLAVDEDGRFNTSDLGATRAGRLPARHFLVRGLLCHVQTPGGRESIRFDRLECGLDPATGKVRFLGEVRPQRDLRADRTSNERQFGIDAEITVPRLNPAVALGGQIKVEWTGLALADLPLGLIPRIPFEQVDGTTTGRVAVATEPDLQLDFNLDVTLDGVRIRRRGSPQTALVPDARVRATGRWNPNTDVVLLQDLEYETPGIRVVGRAEQGRPSLRIDLAGAPPMEAHLSGKVKDWQRLRQELPALDRWAEEAQTSLAGSAEFKLDLDHRQREDRLALIVNAVDAACRLSRNERVLFAAGRQVPKRIEADVTVSRGQTLRIQHRLNFSLGGLTLTGSGDVTLPHPLPDEPADLVRAVLNETLPSLQGDWAIQCPDLQEVLAMCPALAQSEGVHDWRGPLEAKLTCTPSGQLNRLHARIAKGESGTLRFRDLVEVKAGYPLVVELGCDLPQATASHLGELIVTVSHGPAELKLDSANAGIDYQFDFAESGPAPQEIPIAVDVSWRLPVRVKGVEQLAGLWPGWAKFFPPTGTRRLAGDANLLLAGRISTRPGDRVLRFNADLNADDVAVRWDDVIDKPAGIALTAVATYRREQLDNRRDQSWTGALRRPAGSIEAALRRSSGDESSGGGRGLEHAWLRVDITDLGQWLAICPRLRRDLSDYQPSGGVTVALDSLTAAGRQDLTLEADATKADFRVPGQPPIVKSIGVEATLACRWQHAGTDQSPEDSSWHLRGGRLHVAGVHLAEITGSVDAASLQARSDLSTLQGVLSGRNRPEIRSADLQMRGGVQFDPELLSIHPYVRQWGERLKLGGRTALRASLHHAPGRLSLTGRLDGETMSASIPVANHCVPTINKPVGTPASLTFDVAMTENPTGQRRLALSEVNVDVDGNDLTVIGDVDFTGASLKAARPTNFDLTGRLRIAAPGNIVKLLPGSQVGRVEGCCDLNVALAGSPGRWSPGASRLSFDRFVAAVGDDVVLLDGQVSFDRQAATFDQLRCGFGASEGVVSGQVRFAEGSRMGRLGLVFDRLDLTDLQARVDRWTRQEGGAATRQAQAESAAARAVIEELRRCEIEIDAHADLCRAMLPGPQRLRAEVGSAKILIQKGPLAIDFRALVDGGLVTGEFTSHTQVAEPTFHLTYTAVSILPGPLVEGYLRLMFPGMAATGPLTLIDETYQKLLPRPGESNYEVGEGELIIRGGSIAGRAAPLWVTRMFPGLNLARFDFSYMHSWFRKLPNGQVEHQMIYQGQYYNVYMIGHTDTARRFRYEVGLDFLADFDSRYWAESGQGRIPLFIKTGRIDDRGKLIEEEVNFVSPDRVLSTLFVQNNPVVTAYYAVRQRVLGEK